MDEVIVQYVGHGQLEVTCRYFEMHHVATVVFAESEREAAFQFASDSEYDAQTDSLH